MHFIKQSTATTLMAGPFLDSTDGYSLETGLSIPSGNIRLSKNGGAFAATASAISLTHNESGWYSGLFNTTDTNTLGSLTLSIYVSGALPVWKDYTVVPSTIYDWFIGTASLSTTTSGLTPAALGSIVSSGNAAGWSNTITPVTASGLTAPALTQIVSSGTAAGWATLSTAPVTVSGFTTGAITPTAFAASSLAAIAGSNTTSGIAAGFADDVVTVSGFDPYALSQIVSSGTAAGWGLTATAPVTVSGLTSAALSQIVSSGNAANWSGVANISGIATQTDVTTARDNIIATGNANWVTASGFSTATALSDTMLVINTISGYVDSLEPGQSTIMAQISGVPTISTIVSSGTAAGWALTATAPVTVSGLTAAALSQIIASGNAAVWTGIGATVTPTGIFTVTTSGLTPEALTQVISSGNVAGWGATSEVGPIVTGIFNEILAGTLDFRTAQIEQWAYAANDVNLSGTASGVYHSYYGPNNSGLFILGATPSGRIRTDL